MDFILDFKNKITLYRPKWQVGDGCQATLFTQFIHEEESHYVEYAIVGT